MNVYSDIAMLYGLLSGRLKRLVWFVLTLSIINTLLDIVGFSLIIPLLISMVDGNSTSNWGSLHYLQNLINDKLDFDFIIYVMITYFTFKVIVQIWIYFYQSDFVQSVKQFFIQKIITQIYLQQVFSERKNYNQTINQMTIEMNQLVAHVLQPSLTIISEFLIIVFFIIFSLSVDFWATIVLFSLLGCIMFLMQWSVRANLQKMGARRRVYEEIKQLGLNEILVLSKELYLYQGFGTFRKKFDQSVENLRRVEGQQYAITQLPRVIMEFLLVTCMLTVVLLHDEGKSQNTLEYILFYGALASRLLPSANRIVGSLNALQYASVVVAFIREQLTCGVDSLSTNQRLKRNSYFQTESDLRSIYFENVGHTFENMTDQIHLPGKYKLSVGQKIAITGDSGSGKTTLIETLMGFRELSKGKISLKPDANLDEIFSYVSQENVIIEGSILENITLREENPDIMKAKKCLAYACLDINSFQNGIYHSVAQRGSNLSGGQRQRISIARALYFDKSVMILDEPTSALDLQTELELRNNLSKIDDKIIIIITHRPALLDICDVVIRL